MAMKIHRCRICGETYLGEEIPDKCPFCGAERTFLIPGNTWKDENIDLKLSEISSINIKAAIDLEVGNSRFYLCAAKAAKGKDNELEGMFKRLAKVEKEHADLLSKMIQEETPEIISTPLECNEDGLSNVLESSKREKNAVEHYTKFLNEANEPRVKTVFGALIAVERTHLDLDETEKSRLSLIS